MAVGPHAEVDDVELADLAETQLVGIGPLVAVHGVDGVGGAHFLEQGLAPEELIGIGVVGRDAPLVGPVHVHGQPVDLVDALGGESLVTGPGRALPAQGETEQVVWPAPEGRDDPGRERSGHVVDHDQLSVHGEQATQRAQVAADRARSQMVSGSRWVSPSAREVASGSSARGKVPPRSADARFTRDRGPGGDRPLRPAPPHLEGGPLGLPPALQPDLDVLGVGERYLAGQEAELAISHPPSSWRGPILPVISRLSTPWSQACVAAATRTGRPAAPATAAAGSRTGRRRCGGGLAPAGCACGRCRRRRDCRRSRPWPPRGAGSVGSGTSPTYQTATGRSESVKGSTTESRWWAA